MMSLLLLTNMSSFQGEFIGRRMVYWYSLRPFRTVVAQRQIGVSLVNVSLGSLAQYLLSVWMAFPSHSEAHVPLD